MSLTASHRAGLGPYRIPPLKEGTYLVFARGRSHFCVRAGDVKEVLVAGQTTCLDESGSDDDPSSASMLVLDVAAELGSVDEPATEAPLVIGLATNPVVYVVADQIKELWCRGRSLEDHELDELISDRVLIDGEEVPLLDIWGVCFRLQSREFEDQIRSLIPAGDEKILSLVCRPVQYSDTDGDGPGMAQEEITADDIEQSAAGFTNTEPIGRLYDVCVVGGLGHVGLPLGISLADAGLRVSLYDLNEESLRQVSAGKMPFLEVGAEEALKRTLGKTLTVTADRHVIAESYYVMVVIGTPVDEHLNPRFTAFKRFIDEILDMLDDEQHLVLRSTVYPGTTEKIKRYLEQQGLKTRVSFCPERIVQGQAMEELRSLPQIVSSFDKASVEEARALFGHLTDDILELPPTEAELGKLFANVWRYVNFAISNQFYEIAASHGLDFYRIHAALTKNYPRLKGLYTPGFSAGPCLFKDTMQLAAFSDNDFFLGHSAMLINEGLPNFVVKMLKQKYPLEDLNVGLLGMAFKADNDDKRSSLSYKLKTIMEMEARSVLCSDVYIQDPGFVCAEELIDQADVVVVATPHREYQNLEIDDNKILVDVWNFYGKGGSF